MPVIKYLRMRLPFLISSLCPCIITFFSCISTCFSLSVLLQSLLPVTQFSPNRSTRAAVIPVQHAASGLGKHARTAALRFLATGATDRTVRLRPTRHDTTRVCVNLSLGQPVLPFLNENAEVRRRGQHALAARYRGRCSQQPLLPVATRLLLQQGRQGRPARLVEPGWCPLGSHRICQTAASTYDRECPLGHSSDCLVLPRQPDRRQRTRWAAHCRLWRKRHRHPRGHAARIRRCSVLDTGSLPGGMFSSTLSRTSL